MAALRRLAVAVFLAFPLLVAHPGSAAAATPGPCQDGPFPSGAFWRVCVPISGWNGQLVIFAHGYVPPQEPLGFQNLVLPDGTSLPALVQSFGFAFATTTYRQNGLAILEGVDDVRDLAEMAAALIGGAPTRIWLAGVSEGGLVTALAAERAPRLFAGAYSTCGPIGDFRYQINTIGDFRVLFDYFFPGVVPGSPVAVPAVVTNAWDVVYKPAVLGALVANPGRTSELLKVARVPFDALNPAQTVETVIALLEYNVFGAIDAIQKLHGQPFENRLRWYSGSSNDLRLNILVRRFAADPAAVSEMRKYTTSGRLTIPMVTLHTLGDGIVPFAHELLYALKFRPSARGRFLPLPVARYGHCTFTANEVLLGLGLLVAQ